MSKLELDKNTRLLLIRKAIFYCKDVEASGMPPSAWKKALREPIFFLWEQYRKKKHESARYRSIAIGTPVIVMKGIVYDHAIPINIIIEMLMQSDKKLETIENILNNYVISVLITDDEDRLLSKSGLRSKLPADCGLDGWRARYESVGIEITDNEHYTSNSEV